MAVRVVHNSDFRNSLMSLAGLLAVAMPLVFALLQAMQTLAQSQTQNTAAASPVYEVASIKPNKSDNPRVFFMFSPNGFTATKVSLQMLIETAYGVEENRISGAPSWANSEKYDIEAKMDSSVADDLRKLSEDQRTPARQRMLQALLADRFKLRLHRENRDLPVYELVIAKNGPKLHKAKTGDTYTNGVKGSDGRPAGTGTWINGDNIIGQGIPISDLVEELSQRLGRAVVDETGLTGNYDFTLRWTPDDGQAPTGAVLGDAGATLPDSSGPSIFSAIQAQLGLKLESKKGPVPVLVVDHVERPSEN